MPKLTLTFPSGLTWSPSTSANPDEPVVVPTTETVLSSTYPEVNWTLVPLTNTHSQLATTAELGWSQAEIHAALAETVSPPRAELPGDLNGVPFTLLQLLDYFGVPSSLKYSVRNLLTGELLSSLAVVGTFNPTLHLQFSEVGPALTPLTYRALKELLL